MLVSDSHFCFLYLPLAGLLGKDMRWYKDVAGKGMNTRGSYTVIVKTVCRPQDPCLICHEAQKCIDRLFLSVQITFITNVSVI